jgi:glycosyltransferase involved in cell wall biosynthesis
VSEAKVDLVISCFDVTEYLRDAVSSVVSQSLTQWRCIVVDDGSSDCNSRKIREEVPRSPQFEYLRQHHCGLPAARNAGFRMGSAPYLIALDADDVLAPRFLENAVAILDERPKTHLVYGRVQYFGQRDGEMPVPLYSRYAIKVRNPICASALFRRVDFERVGGYDPNLADGLEDWDLWISILKERGVVHRLEAIGLYYRQHPLSMVARMPPIKWAAAKEYIRRKHADFCL